MDTAQSARIELTLSQLAIDPSLNGAEVVGNEGFWTVIDAADHGGIAMVVTRMSDDTFDYLPGVVLAHRITQLPAVIASLRSILNAENLLDARTSAKQALAALQIA